MEQPIARRSLAGEWQVSAADDERWLPARVPGDVYHDLYRAGEIPDPFVGEQELDVQWVGETDWTYRQTIGLDADRLGHDEHRLVFDGLDAVATVHVNGERVGRGENAHRRYAFDVGDALVAGENEVVVRFESPVQYARERAAAYPDDLSATHYPVEQPHRNFVRKPQCQFGWDWGVCLPTVGVWRDVELVSFSEPRLTDVAVGQDHSDVAVGAGRADGAGPDSADATGPDSADATGPDSADATGPDSADGSDSDPVDGAVSLQVDVRTEAPAAGDYVATVAVADAETAERVALDAGIDQFSVELAVEEPELWWPAGHGDQPLYDLTVVLSPADDRGSRLDEATERIGFREVELVREPDDAGDGESFTIEVNGRPIFAKGANWIPADGIPSRVAESDYRRLLEDAVAANMNAIRVWGGGQYERDAFYETCDELGLLVWQDLMFACACYPVDDAFVENVVAEASQQVRRLASHPSIALWCGNNEVEYLFDELVGEDSPDRERLQAEHDRLFRETLGPVVRETDPDDRAYWPSSPASRGEESADCERAPAPGDEAAGDVHVWDVWHGGEPFAAYLDLEPRFASEFGYQSFPSVETLRTALDEADLNPTAPAMEHHQRNPGGNARILERMADNFRVPWSFEAFVYLSQVQQALAMRTAIEHWRRLQPHCMGTLYWQLNDMWPVASWSSIEYGGRWKALHYAARRFYAPVLVSLVHVDHGGDPVGRRSDDAERIQVWLTADGPTAPEGDVEITAETFDGTVLHEETADVDVGARGSEAVATLDPEQFGAPAERVLVRAEHTGGAEAFPAFETLEAYKRLDLPEVELDVTVEGDAVTVAADAAALYVQLDATPLDGHFSDNWFHLAAGEERTVRFERRAGEDGSLADALSVRHLREPY